MNKKRNILLAALLLTLAAPLRAQVFMMDGDENYRDPEDPAVFVQLPADYGSGTDYYTPIGNGLMLLTALGGAYLLGKRRSYFVNRIKK